VQSEAELNVISHINGGKIPCSVNVLISKKLKENICQLAMHGNIWTFFPPLQPIQQSRMGEEEV